MQLNTHHSLRWVVVFLFSIACVGCTHHEVNSWERWCEQITGVDLETRYNRRGGFFAVSFDADAIRDDFVDKFSQVIVTQAASQYLGGVEPENQVVQELVRLKMLGVWRLQTHLHWANSLDEYALFLNSVESALANYRERLFDGERSSDLPFASRCFWGTLDGVFSGMTLHGAGDRSSTIELRHTLQQ